MKMQNARSVNISPWRLWTSRRDVRSWSATRRRVARPTPVQQQPAAAAASSSSSSSSQQPRQQQQQQQQQRQQQQRQQQQQQQQKQSSSSSSVSGFVCVSNAKAPNGQKTIPPRSPAGKTNDFRAEDEHVEHTICCFLLDRNGRGPAMISEQTQTKPRALDGRRGGRCVSAWTPNSVFCNTDQSHRGRKLYAATACHKCFGMPDHVLPRASWYVLFSGGKIINLSLDACSLFVFKTQIAKSTWAFGIYGGG